MKSDDAFWSLSSEYDWVCDKNEVGSEVLVAVQVGIIVTALIFMQLSDTYGRVPIFHITNIIYIVMRLVAMHITSHYWAFLLLMGAGSTFSPLGIRIAYTLGKTKHCLFCVPYLNFIRYFEFSPVSNKSYQNTLLSRNV